MELKTLLCNLGITKDWDKYAEVYAPAMEKYEKEGSWYLEEDFLRGCQRKYNMLGKYEEPVLEAARQLRADEDLKRYLAIIQYIVHERPDAPALLGRIPLPPVKSEETRLKTELMPFFAYLPEGERMYDFAVKNDFPEESIDCLLGGFRDSIEEYASVHKRPGYDHVFMVWSTHFTECKMMKFHGVQFELNRFASNVVYLISKTGKIEILGDGETYHKSGNKLGNLNFEDKDGSFEANFIETDDYFEGVRIVNSYAVNERVRFPKKEWKRLLSKGDNVINIHLPAGTDISEGTLAKAYAAVEEMVFKAFPDYGAKAVTGYSWLLDPALDGMLSPTSRILGFSHSFIKFPMKSSGMDVFMFLFTTEDRDYTKLPENTSLERAVKKYYIDGNYIHKFGGVFFTEKQIEAALKKW